MEAFSKSTDSKIIYEIVVSGYISPDWSDRLGGMSISPSKDTSLLSGQLLDQSELNGVISTLVNQRHTIISVLKKDN